LLLNAKVFQTLKKEYKITFADGQGKLKDKIFRIAHMGFSDQMNIIIAISGLEMALHKVGYSVELGAGDKAAQQIFLGV
jgi:aspartate aminotransferase-like enzyme